MERWEVAIPRPSDWLARVNRTLTKKELERGADFRAIARDPFPRSQFGAKDLAVVATLEFEAHRTVTNQK